LASGLGGARPAVGFALNFFLISRRLMGFEIFLSATQLSPLAVPPVRNPTRKFVPAGNEVRKEGLLRRELFLSLSFSRARLALLLGICCVALAKAARSSGRAAFDSRILFLVRLSTCSPDQLPRATWAIRMARVSEG
jgi:hypothetical protein